MIDAITPGQVSVIIPAFNSERTIKLCIEAVVRSDYPHVEIIVVDDGSTDNTSAIASKFPLVRCFRKENGGSASAKNFGAASALGEYLYFLDSDVIVETATITRLVRTITSHDVDIAVGRYSTRPMNNGIIHHYKALADYVMYIPKSYRHKPIPNGQIGGGGDLFTAKVFRALGGFSERYRGATVEREELYLRCYEAGYRSVADPTIKTAHFFPDFGTLVRNYMSRIPLTMELVTEREGPFTYLSGEKAVLAPFAAALSIILIPACLVSGAFAGYALSSMALFLIFSREMIVESYRRKPLLMSAQIIGIHFVVCAIVFVIGTASFVKNTWRKLYA